MKSFKQIAEESKFELTEASNVRSLKRDVEYAYIAFSKAIYALDAESKTPEVKALLNIVTDGVLDALEAVKKKVK